MNTPITPLHLASVAKPRVPRRAMSTPSQKTASTTPSTNTRLLERPSAVPSLGSTKASAVAPKVRVIGISTQPWAHSRNTAMKPRRPPKASPTHRKTPPFSGQAVASSAATRATGIRKKTAANRK